MARTLIFYPWVKLLYSLSFLKSKRCIDAFSSTMNVMICIVRDLIKNGEFCKITINVAMYIEMYCHDRKSLKLWNDRLVYRIVLVAVWIQSWSWENQPRNSSKASSRRQKWWENIWKLKNCWKWMVVSKDVKLLAINISRRRIKWSPSFSRNTSNSH